MPPNDEKRPYDARIDPNNVLDLLSHDIGNVAQTIMARLDMIDAGGDGRIAAIAKEVEAMHRMVKNVRIAYHAATHPFTPADLDLFTVLGSSAEKARRMSGDGRMELDIGPARNDVAVKADGMIVDMFAELMLNSIQFAGPAMARITVRAERTGHGLLIVYEDLSPICDLQRVERSASRMIRLASDNDFHGSGTGLMMVGALVHRYGGHVRFENRSKGDPRSGLRTVIELPGM